MGDILPLLANKNMASKIWKARSECNKISNNNNISNSFSSINRITSLNLEKCWTCVIILVLNKISI